MQNYSFFAIVEIFVKNFWYVLLKFFYINWTFIKKERVYSQKISFMILEHLSVIGYRNVAQADLDFCTKINAFVGLNGTGKTTLLDAVYYLSFCKSSLGATDSILTKHGMDGFMIHGQYCSELQNSQGQVTVSAGYQLNKRKHFSYNKKEYSRYSDHIGVIPLVISSPSDLDLIGGVSADRRKFMDMIISQYDKEYLSALIYYTHALEQRNSMLRSGQTDDALYSAVEYNMNIYAKIIYSKRCRFVAELVPLFGECYGAIGAEAEKVAVEYSSCLSNGALDAQLEQSRRKDMILGYTSVGVHRDDLEMTLDGFAVRKEASQGQKKNFLIALRFAQYKMLKSLCNTEPILLLDDLFDKLDNVRVSNIIKFVSSRDFGQIFITDTTQNRLDDMLQEYCGNDYRLFQVSAGMVK